MVNEHYTRQLESTCADLLKQLNCLEKEHSLYTTSILPSGDLCYQINKDKCKFAENVETERTEDFVKGYEKGVKDKEKDFEEGMRLLRATLEILNKAHDEHFVTSAMELTYTSKDDDEIIETDGYCLREEIQDFLNVPLNER